MFPDVILRRGLKPNYNTQLKNCYLTFTISNIHPTIPQEHPDPHVACPVLEAGNSAITVNSTFSRL